MGAFFACFLKKEYVVQTDIFHSHYTRYYRKMMLGMALKEFIMCNIKNLPKMDIYIFFYYYYFAEKIFININSYWPILY